ncbi:expressed unknown protein [Seminavis robusta]|uniref:Uncharacterized protein n=1 Tax=Seminavis robusta TaxID=568900 RepID=A0A9N8DDN8_9STRA|nr:expressed unknown protein [Seminavis robusta]|eukprot:Sro71_g039340.1 n/a (171) ;mRNA; f:52902-53414
MSIVASIVSSWLAILLVVFLPSFSNAETCRWNPYVKEEVKRYYWTLCPLPCKKAKVVGYTWVLRTGLDFCINQPDGSSVTEFTPDQLTFDFSTDKPDDWKKLVRNGECETLADLGSASWCTNRQIDGKDCDTEVSETVIDGELTKIKHCSSSGGTSSGGNTACSSWNPFC